jgi:MFS transporter, NNP family, nitrate/nitrite transporter
MNARWQMPGRLWAQSLLLAGGGVTVLILANSKTLGGALTALIVFSCFVQSSEGTSFGIVPYIDPPHTGTVTGIVGAGGNVGAVAFGLAFRQLEDRKALTIMGIAIMISSILPLIMVINGQDSVILRRKKDQEVDLLPEESPKQAEPSSQCSSSP